MIPRQRGEPKPRRDSDKYGVRARRQYRLLASAWPEVDDTSEIVAALTADTVLQIIRGQGYYYGLGAEQEREPAIVAGPTRRRRAKPKPLTDRELVKYAIHYPEPPIEAPELIAYLTAAIDRGPRRLTERELVEQMFGR